MEKRTRSYLQLVKPGITFSNTIAAAAGALLAMSQVEGDWPIIKAFAAIIAIAFIIAGACVVNNIIDRDIDRKMKRTSRRELVEGTISLPRAALFSFVLEIIGFGLLAYFTNVVTVTLGIVAVIWYVIIYGYAKRHTVWSTVIGGVAGALPPAAGYTAMTGSIDAAAITLFLILYFWQMPHFYAIAIFRKKEYAAGGLPIWTVKRSVREVKVQMLVFVILFSLSWPLLTIFGYTGILFTIGMLALSLYWVGTGIKDYQKVATDVWAKKIFGISLLVLLAMCGLIAVGGYIP